MRIPRLPMLALLIWSVAWLPLHSSVATAAEEPLIVVAGPTFVGSDISFADLKSAFRGQVVQVGGVKLIPVNSPLGAPVRVSFDRIVLGLDPAAVGRFWVDMRIRDQGKPPTTASSPDLALRIAGALKGALTYTTKSKLPAGNFKVLTIDGKAAGQAGYALAL
jgi:hypothetical protein